MSASDTDAAPRFGATPSVRSLMNEWAADLAELLESMTGQRPDVHWQAVSGAAAEAGAAADAGMLWWEQALQFSPEALIWVGAPRAAWEHAATLMLKAAGLGWHHPRDRAQRALHRHVALQDDAMGEGSRD